MLTWNKRVERQWCCDMLWFHKRVVIGLRKCFALCKLCLVGAPFITIGSGAHLVVLPWGGQEPFLIQAISEASISCSCTVSWLESKRTWRSRELRWRRADVGFCLMLGLYGLMDLMVQSIVKSIFHMESLKGPIKIHIDSIYIYANPIETGSFPKSNWLLPQQPWGSSWKIWI